MQFKIFHWLQILKCEIWVSLTMVQHHHLRNLNQFNIISFSLSYQYCIIFWCKKTTEEYGVEQLGRGRAKYEIRDKQEWSERNKIEKGYMILFHLPRYINRNEGTQENIFKCDFLCVNRWTKNKINNCVFIGNAELL